MAQRRPKPPQHEPYRGTWREPSTSIADQVSRRDRRSHWSLSRTGQSVLAVAVIVLLAYTFTVIGFPF